MRQEEQIRKLRHRIEEETAVIVELAVLLENSAGVGVRRQDWPGQRHKRRSSVDQKAPRIRTVAIRLEKLPKKHGT